MPELPEVETVRRGLVPHLEGRTIARVRLARKDLRFPFSERFAERLEGITVRRLERRAKYLLAHLSSGEVLLSHLGMTGRFSIREAGSAASVIGAYEYNAGPPELHAHVRFEIESGTEIIYSDPRRFGFMLLIEEDALLSHPMLAPLGVEPLGDGLTPFYLAAKARATKRDLKAFLLDQRVIAGLGNIYVCEALHRVGLKPSRRASVLALRNGSPSEAAVALVSEIRAVLEAALQAGGSTLRDYRHADGSEGSFQDTFLVYGREGEPCVRPRCHGIVRRSIQSGRSSFFCPVCQR